MGQIQTNQSGQLKRVVARSSPNINERLRPNIQQSSAQPAQQLRQTQRKQPAQASDNVIMSQRQTNQSGKLTRVFARSFSYDDERLQPSSRQSSGPSSQQSRRIEKHSIQSVKEMKDPEPVRDWKQELDSLNLPLEQSSLVDPSYELIGEGGFSSVYTIPTTSSTQTRPVVLRVQELNLIDLHPALVQGNQPAPPRMKFRHFKTEVELIQLMSTKNISPKVHRQWYIINKDEDSPAFGFPAKHFVIMDKYTSDLLTFLDDLGSKKGLRSLNTRLIAKQISRQLIDLISRVASLEWLLLDIKAENIVIDVNFDEGDNKVDLSARLIDFCGVHCKYLRTIPKGMLAGIMILILIFQFFYTFTEKKEISLFCTHIIDELSSFLSSLSIKERRDIRYQFLYDTSLRLDLTLDGLGTIGNYNSDDNVNSFVSYYLRIPTLRKQVKLRYVNQHPNRPKRKRTPRRRTHSKNFHLQKEKTKPESTSKRHKK